MTYDELAAQVARAIALARGILPDEPGKWAGFNSDGSPGPNMTATPYWQTILGEAHAAIEVVYASLR